MKLIDAWVSFKNIPGENLCKKTNYISSKIYDFCDFQKDCFGWLLRHSHKSVFRMSEIYSDHMVLQRDKILKIRGHAPVGAHIVFSFAGYRKETFAGIDGCWCITVPPISKGGPYVMEVRCGWHRLIFKDILMGEVWLTAGASCMLMHLYRACTGTEEMNFWKNCQTEGKRPFILHVFEKNVHRNSWLFPFSYIMCKWFDRYELLHHSEWKSIDAQIVGSIAAYPYYFAKEISKRLDVPVGLINMAIGGCPIESYVEREVLEEFFPDLIKGEPNPYSYNDHAKYVRKNNLRFAFNKHQKHYYDPGYAFESQIRSLDAYPIKGVLYGGFFWHKDQVPCICSLFSMMVSSWRRVWRENMPVYYLQLGRFHDETLNSSSLPEMRDALRRLSDAVSDTYMIVTYDRLDNTEKDVLHPKDRSVVGERLGKSALYHTYGQTDIVPSEPKFLQAVLEENLIRIRFECSEGLHTLDGKEPSEFEISADDFHFVPVKARIEEDQILIENVLNSPPVYVRYTWKDYPEVSVANGQDWPLSTFCEKIETYLEK